MTANIPHPSGGGRQQPDAAGLTIQTARFVNSAGDAAVIETAEAGAIAASVEDTPALWAALLAWRDAGGTIAPYQPPPAPRRLVDKGTITERIIAAGKLDAALAALRALPIEDQQRWTNKTAVYADDARARGLLERIGLDPDVILAP